MHGYNYGGFFLTLGFSITTIGMILWFRDIIKEASYEGAHTKQVQNGIMLGFILFIVSEAFAFLSVFWAFFHSALSPAIEIGGCWPPQGIVYAFCQFFSATLFPIIIPGQEQEDGCGLNF